MQVERMESAQSSKNNDDESAVRLQQLIDRLIHKAPVYLRLLESIVFSRPFDVAYLKLLIKEYEAQGYPMLASDSASRLILLDPDAIAEWNIVIGRTAMEMINVLTALPIYLKYYIGSRAKHESLSYQSSSIASSHLGQFLKFLR